MGWFKRRRKKDDFEEKYGDLLGFSEKIEEATKETEKEEVHYQKTPEQRKRFVEQHLAKIAEATMRIEETKREYQAVGEYLSDIQRIDSLPEDSRENVRKLAKKVTVLAKDRRDYGASMSKMKASKYEMMKSYGDDIRDVLKDMAEDEKFCQDVREDLHRLEGEKHASLYERKAMRNRIYLVKEVSKIAVAAFSVLILLLLFIQLKSGKNVMPFLYGIMLAGVIAAFSLFLLHYSAVRRLGDAEFRLNHIIQLLNKVKLRYVNVESRLEYLYDKFEVHNSYELSKMWSTFLQTEKEQEVFHKASDKLYLAEEDLVELLKQYQVNDAEIWLKQVNALFDEKEMEGIRKSLSERRQRLYTLLEYQTEIKDTSGQAIKDLIAQNKEHAEEIMAVVDAFSANT